MKIENSIKIEVENRNIRRICHFTQSRNFLHITSGPEGLLATNLLSEKIYTPTDQNRQNGKLGHICCSIEYPNAWYFEKARADEKIFKDWIILMICPKYLWQEKTLFCYRNASAFGGRLIGEGKDAFHSMFAKEVTGSNGIIFKRTDSHLSSCPTDNQAEVLIPNRISLEDIFGFIVQTETQAKDEMARLRRINPSKTDYDIRIAPILYDKYKLADLIRKGIRPQEIQWNTEVK